MSKIQIVEKKIDSGYYYDIFQDNQLIHHNIGYDESLELANSLGGVVEIIYLSGVKPSFQSELNAKRRMDKKGW